MEDVCSSAVPPLMAEKERTSKLDEHRELLRHFISVYETLPELWDPSNPWYVDKKRRNVALDKLLIAFAKIKPDADRADVRKKINILRSNYRKELKKIRDSRRVDESGEYVPSSWVFHQLKFLRKTEADRALGLSNSPDDSREDADHEDLEMSLREPCIELHVDAPSLSTASSLAKNNRPIKKRKVRGSVSTQDRMLTSALGYLASSSNSAAPECEYMNLAKVWSSKLKELELWQKVFAEKAINDVLFEARLGNLNKESVKINEGRNVVYEKVYSASPESPDQASCSSPTRNVHSPVNCQPR